MSLCSLWCCVVQVREHAATLPQPPTPAAADAAATTAAAASSTDTVVDSTAVAATENSSNGTTTATTAAAATAAVAEPAVLSDWDRQMLNEEVCAFTYYILHIHDLRCFMNIVSAISSLLCHSVCLLVSACMMRLTLSSSTIEELNCNVTKRLL
jgi:hypothetical protein